MNNDKVDYFKKALVVTTVASTLDQFCMNGIKILQKTYSVSVAANFYVGNNTSQKRVKEFKAGLQEKNIVVNEINFNRNPFSKANFFAYKDIKKLINSNSFEIIHCHTPVAAMAVRLAARKARQKGTKVIYTAHGFHFYKGAPLKNWLLYYPIERWLARYTDVLITINKEDYERAKKSFRAGKVEYIPGVGVDTKKFGEVIVDKVAKRREVGVPENAFVILSVGELNKNKNHETVIKAIAKLNNSNVYYLICGQGILENYLNDLIKKLYLEKQVKVLGYRTDIGEISKTSDVFVFPSYREGLSVALMEAMALGLPVVCSNIRGNIDLIENGKGGYIVGPDDVGGFTGAIDEIIQNQTLNENMGKYNKECIAKFDIDNVKADMEKIYFEV
ncbi:glycosyltransferase family 4 protein [Clostridium estertheticum]|uniref:glycosyltransferase family 4 protein n=1 Tax=Clostridium estertheticum TaxID=238834 RepID=UPI001CF208FD|nr:glycosyltransferase family 4 protein [Clostridium estertheticum]MCB2339582.1 glycosyltransferase family 4 protein [Clostridium estertheticum]